MTADHPTREERYAAVLAEHEDVSMDVTTPREFTQYGGWNRNCQCGHPLPDGDAPDEVFYAAHRAHVAAALVAADPAPAQPDAALSDESRVRHALLSALLDEYGADEETWMAMGSLRRVTRAVLLAARAAQPVCCDGTSQEVSSQQDRDESPAPEVSRGVAEVKRASWHHGCTCKIAPQWSLLVEHDPDCPFRKALDRIVRNAELRAWDEGYAAGVNEVRGEDSRPNPYRAHPTDDGADCCRERTTAGGCGCGRSGEGETA